MNCTYLGDLWEFGCWLLTGVQVNELDPGIDAVRSSTEHTQGHLHSTRVPGPDTSGYGIVTFFKLRTYTKLDTIPYSRTNTYANYVQYKMLQNTGLYWA